MNDNFTVLVQIKNEPVRVNAIIDNFKKIAKVIYLLDFEDTTTSSVLLNNNCEFIIRPKEFTNWGWEKKEFWILNQSKTEYVLIAYASMFFPLSLLKIFQEISLKNQYDAVFHPLTTWSHGKMVQQPFIYKRSSACHFFKKSAINSHGSKIHNHFAIKSDINIFKVPATKNFAIHVFRDDDMPIVTKKHIGYAEIEAAERISKEKKIKLIHFIYILIKSFLNGYIRDKGYKAGMAGFIYHFNFTVYTFLVYSRIWELQNENTFVHNRNMQTKLRTQMIEKEQINF
jgi:hypothetical protein